MLRLMLFEGSKEVRGLCDAKWSERMWEVAKDKSGLYWGLRH